MNSGSCNINISPDIGALGKVRALCFPPLVTAAAVLLRTCRYHSEIGEHHYATLSINDWLISIKGGGVTALQGWVLLAIEALKPAPGAGGGMPRLARSNDNTSNTLQDYSEIG